MTVKLYILPKTPKKRRDRNDSRKKSWIWWADLYECLEHVGVINWQKSKPDKKACRRHALQTLSAMGFDPALTEVHVIP